MSLILVAVGAVLAFAVDYTVTGIDIRVVGAVLMVVGSLGLALSLLFWASFSPFRQGRSSGSDRVVVVDPPDDRPSLR